VMRDGQLCAQLDRATLEQSLRRYVVTGIDEGAAERVGDAASDTGDTGETGGPHVTVVSRRGGAQEAEWIVWGDEGRVTGAFERAGGTVRTVRSVPLVDAARALMTFQGVAQ